MSSPRSSPSASRRAMLAIGIGAHTATVGVLLGPLPMSLRLRISTGLDMRLMSFCNRNREHVGVIRKVFGQMPAPGELGYCPVGRPAACVAVLLLVPFRLSLCPWMHAGSR